MSINPYSYYDDKIEQDTKKMFKSSINSTKSNEFQDDILKIISKECMVPMYKIMDRTRTKEVVNARYIFCAIMKINYTYTLEKIGKIIGRDHSTVMHAIQQFYNRYKTEDNFKLTVNKIYSKIGI